MNRVANYLGLGGAIAVGAYISHHGYEWGMTFGQIKMLQLIGGAIAGRG